MFSRYKNILSKDSLTSHCSYVINQLLWSTLKPIPVFKPELRPFFSKTDPKQAVARRGEHPHMAQKKKAEKYYSGLTHIQK